MGQRTISVCSTVDQTDIRGFGPHDTDSSWSYLGLNWTYPGAFWRKPYKSMVFAHFSQGAWCLRRDGQLLHEFQSGLDDRCRLDQAAKCDVGLTDSCRGARSH